jgi:hypothetical protein
MATNIKVVLFEDIEQRRSEILKALKKHLKPDGEVTAFDGSLFSESADDKQRMYEDRLENILRKPPYDGATLLVVDRDLSKSQSYDFRGLSVNAVATASKRLAIPICSYARQPELDDYEWRGRWEEGHIVLRVSEGDDELARRSALAARGFAEIAAQLPQVMRVRANNSPAKILAALLGKPEYSDKITLYSVGDQNRLSEILPKAKQPRRQLQERMTCFLGYWLWDSLLRYPGLLVNEVAAASYLNIATNSFRDSRVQAIFKEALYRGPFADSRKRQWWRGMLDDIVSRQNCADGLELARKKVTSTIKRSRCCVDPSKPAGYYCIISCQPVSLENSKGGFSWFPRGADLTRISKTKFDEYGPWLGV